MRRGLSKEGNLRFKIDWASLIVGSKFTVLVLFYFVFEGNFPGRGDLTEGFLRYRFGGLILEGLIHGGAYFRSFMVFKEYPQKSQICQSETSSNQGIPNQVPWLGLVSLFQIWDFCGYSLNTLKYPKMGISYFFLCEDGYIAKSLQIQYCSALVV